MVGVDVSEDANPLLAGGVELLERHRLDVEVGDQCVAKCSWPGGLADVGEQAVVAEDGQAGVLERDQSHQRVAVRSVAADRVGIGACGLVAVMAVGDQQLGVGELGGDGAMGIGVVDAPGPVTVPSSSVDLGPGLGAGEALEMAPGVAGVQREDRARGCGGWPR